jgi:flagellar biosynthetic protein FliO
MAHRTGRREQLAGPVRQALRTAARRATAALARVASGRPRGLALAAVLVVGAGTLVLLSGPTGRDQVALAAMPVVPAPAELRPSAAPVPASALDSLTGSAGIEPLDLIGKGVIVAALLYLTLRALRRLQSGPASGSRRLQVIETRSLGPKASLHLVAVGERRLVVGLSPGGIVAIAELDATELAEPAGAAEESRSGMPDGHITPAIGAAPVDLRAVVVAGWVAARQLLSSRAIPRLHEAEAVVVRRGTDR